MPTPRFGIVASSIALALVSSSSRLLAQALPGWSYTMNITTDSGIANARSSMAMQQRVTDRYLRMATLQVSGGRNDMSAAEGMYIVYDAVDTTMTMVMTKQKIATVMSLDLVASAQTPHFQMHTDAPARYDDLGAGERILGHATRHHQSTTHGSMEVTLGGESCSKPVNSVSDMWIAPDVDLSASTAAIMKHLGPLAKVTGTGDVIAEAQSKVPVGTPLRTITRNNYTDETGKARTVTTTMEYVEISNAAIDPSEFTAPSDFQVMDARKTMAKLNANPKAKQVMDSASANSSHGLAIKMCQ